MKKLPPILALAQIIDKNNYDFFVNDNLCILELGCGNGDEVYMLRNKGYDTYGADIQFKKGQHVDMLIKQKYICKINNTKYHIPFPDESFDIVFSKQVFEHVHNYEETLQELRRVMKPGAIGVHRFPSRLRPVESHVKVPFSSVIRNYKWILFWTYMGFLKKNQKHLKPEFIAQKNLDYLNSCTNYMSGHKILKKFQAEFSKAGFAEKYWFMVSPNKRGHVLGRFNTVVPLIALIYRTFWTRVIFHIK